jgi:AcrR family transcriptional regulator
VSTSQADHDHHDGLRDRLIAAALQLLAEGDASSVSLRAVARRAGVSAMAPYRHYADKESLLAAVAAQGFAQLRAALEDADGQAADTREALLAQGAAYVRFALSQPALFRLMFGPERRTTHPALKASGETAYGVLARRAAVGRPDPQDAARHALACWALVHGLAGLLLDGLIAPDLAHDPDALTRMVASALLP